ncbi:hypothetical protein ACIOJD_23950 [Streptomyces sp. NPDC088116]
MGINVRTEHGGMLLGRAGLSPHALVSTGSAADVGRIAVGTGGRR